MRETATAQGTSAGRAVSPGYGAFYKGDEMEQQQRGRVRGQQRVVGEEAAEGSQEHGRSLTPRPSMWQRRAISAQAEASGMARVESDKDIERNKERERSLTPRPSMWQRRAMAAQAEGHGLARIGGPEDRNEQEREQNDDDRSGTPYSSKEQLRRMITQKAEGENSEGRERGAPKAVLPTMQRMHGDQNTDRTSSKQQRRPESQLEERSANVPA